MINEIFDSLMNEASEGPYYHLSIKNHGKKVKFIPRETYVFNETSTPRICVAPTIEGALVALGFVLKHAPKIFVYQATGSPEIIPADSSIVDREVTGEMWVLEPTVFERVGNVPFWKIPGEIWDAVLDLWPGTFNQLENQERVKEELKPYIPSMAAVAEAIRDEDEDNLKIKTVPAPMNFDRARARSK